MINGTDEDHKENHVLKKPIFWGITAGLTLLSIYFIVLSFANSFSHAAQQFQDMWYWITLLVAGFSLQVGLYVYIKVAVKLMTDVSATSSVAAAGGISSTSMVACCAHHLTDIIPILGLSAAAVFLNQFQTLFIVIGVLSNLIGINIMLKIVQDHGLYDKTAEGFFSMLMRINMKKALYFSSIFSLSIFVITLFNSL